jgi:hypothetical protein
MSSLVAAAASVAVLTAEPPASGTALTPPGELVEGSIAMPAGPRGMLTSTGALRGALSDENGEPLT